MNKEKDKSARFKLLVNEGIWLFNVSFLITFSFYVFGRSDKILLKTIIDTQLCDMGAVKVANKNICWIGNRRFIGWTTHLYGAIIILHFLLWLCYFFILHVHSQLNRFDVDAIGIDLFNNLKISDEPMHTKKYNRRIITRTYNYHL